MIHRWSEWQFDSDEQARYRLWSIDSTCAENPYLWPIGVKPHVITEDRVYRRDDGVLICRVRQDTEYEP